MNLLAYAIGTLATFLASWGLVSWWIGISQRAKVVDVPNARSSHTRATPRGGGVGIVAATVAGIAVAVFSGRAANMSDASIAGVLALFIAAISFVDDLRSLPSALRLIFHVAAAVTATWKLGSFSALTIPFCEPVTLPAWAGAVLTCVWIVGLTNVYNFMDGIDGIAGTQGVVAGAAWAWFGVQAGETLVIWSGLTIAAACGGFLLLNWAPAKVFMGDVGSAFLGFSFAVLPLLALHGRVAGDAETLRVVGAVPIFAGLVVLPFAADGAYTFLRRVRRRENLLQAHRSHLYQRLTIAGWPHAPVTLLYLGWAALSAAAGGVFLMANDSGRVAALCAALFPLLAILILVKREERRVVRTEVEAAKVAAQ